MSDHCGYVIKVETLRPHPNANKLQLLDVFGTTTTVDLNVAAGDLGVYFPCDLQLSVEFATQNNLARKKDENGNNIGGYLDPTKLNIAAIRMRGEKSDGLYLPLHAFDYCFDDGNAAAHLHVGDRIDMINGHEICNKYIPCIRPNKSHGATEKTSRTRKHKAPIAPLFAEHVDTEQLAYNLNTFKPGDLVEITLKMHGTSQRTGYLPKLQGYRRTLVDRILRRPGKPVYKHDYVTGTRRTVLNDDWETGGFYGSNAFREPHAKQFEGRLWENETVYYEVVGFTHTGAPIMPSVPNSKISDKAFTRQYGNMTVFSYGCKPDARKLGDTAYPEDPVQSDSYVYRMTMTTPEGNVIEYPPDFMRYRCEQMGVKTVPVLTRFIVKDHDDYTGEIFNPGEYVQQIAEQFYDGPDPVGHTHVREGVVCRVVNRPKFTAFKHKNFSFKVLEGLAKDVASQPDMEEAEEEKIGEDS